jgi:hypothetical protein
MVTWVEPAQPEHAAPFIARMAPEEMAEMHAIWRDPVLTLEQVIEHSDPAETRMDDEGPIGFLGVIDAGDGVGNMWMATNPAGLRHMQFIVRASYRFVFGPALQRYHMLRMTIDAAYPQTIKGYEHAGFVFGPEETDGRKRFRVGVLER